MEQDEIDSKPQKFLTAEDTPKAAPVTPQERIEIKAELTNADGQADELQLSQLKKTCKALKDAAKGSGRQKEIEDFLTGLAVATKGFKEISKADCANVLTKIAGLMEEFK